MTSARKLLLLATCAFGPALSGQAALTWSWYGTPPGDPYYTDITNAMNGTCDDFNITTNITFNVLVTYNSGVPTAQTDGYLGLIEFGAQRSQRAASHEVSHYLGTGSYGNWGNFSYNGVWNGAWGKALEQAFDGSGATLNSDSQHYWPYGLNQDTEWTFTTEFRHPPMCMALRQDMGLVNGSKASPIPNGKYKIINRYSGLALEVAGNGTAAGTPTDQYAYSGSTAQQWTLTQMGDGKYQIVNVLNGLTLDDYANATQGQNGSTLDTYTSNNGIWQRWFIQPTSTGTPYFKIVNAYNGMVADVDGVSTANGATVWQWSDLAGPGNQEWSFVPLAAPAVTAPTIKAIVGQPFVYQINATNSATSYSVTGLPSGLSLNATTGRISGTIGSTTGSTNITLKATNAVGSGTATLTLQRIAATNPIANGTYKLVNHASGLVLGASWGSTSNGTPANQYPYQGSGSAGQKWVLTQEASNQYQITCVLDNLALDNYNLAAPGTDGSTIDTWSINNGTYQRWWLQPAPTAGYYYVINVYSGMAMDVQNSSTISNAPIVQNTEHWTTGSQEWSIQAP